MFQDVERYVDFITKNKLTQAEFLFLYLLKRKRVDAIAKYKRAFPSDDGSMIGNRSMTDLIKRGFLIHLGEGEKVSDYEVSGAFNDLFVQDKFEAADEVWKLYPPFVNIGGNDMTLTSCDRYEFAILYAEAIDYNVEEHKLVVEDIKYARDHGLLRISIEKFVRSKGWEAIRSKRSSTGKSQVVNEDNF